MALYRISGVWKNSNNVITAYAFHEVTNGCTGKSVRKTKVEAISLLEKPGNYATTWVWNYNQASWNVGEEVQVIEGDKGKYLRSNSDTQTTDNLAHLMDFDWLLSSRNLFNRFLYSN